MSSTFLYQVLDLIALRATGPIITAYHDAAAVRVFTDALRDPKTTLAQHPDDFAVVRLGSQNEQTGELLPETPVTILTGTQWRMAQEAKADA